MRLSANLTALGSMALTVIACTSKSTPHGSEPPRSLQPHAPPSPCVETTQAPAPTPRIAPLGSSARLEDETNTVAVFKAAASATVFVTQKQTVLDWSMRALEVPAGSGTGFVWDAHGHIVTNYHVVDPGTRGPTTYVVTLYNQKSYEAQLVGGEPRKDIAVLKIDAPATDLTPIRVSQTPSALDVGQKAIAIGNPFGLDHTLTTGVISALGREVEGYGGVSIRDMIQTDASINPGNSGGPLLDSSGTLIGMNTMIFSKSGASAGIGFAVPESTIRRIVPQIVRYGRPRRAGLGIRFVPDQYARQAGIVGVIIGSVEQDSPASEAGLSGLRRAANGSIIVGDVIVGIEETPVHDFDDLYNALDKHEVGAEVTVSLRRDKKELKVRVKLKDVG